MKKRILSTVLVFVLAAAPALSSVIIEDPQQFQINNPDVGKYEFVKHYLTALTYLRNNSRDKGAEDFLSKDNYSDPEEIKRLKERTVLENVNLRVARNYIQKHRRQDHGLILKASDVFVKSCNLQIDLNNRERELLERLSRAQENDAVDRAFQKAFRLETRGIASERKEAFKGLLEASFLVAKILISSQPDTEDRFNRLGITREEREKLLQKLDAFHEKSFQQDQVQEGQSFLEGSIIAIREILEDDRLKNMDE